MKLNIDKEFIEKEVWYDLDQWSADLIERQYFRNKHIYDNENLITSDIKHVQATDYKQNLAKIVINNPYAYVSWTRINNYISYFNPLNNWREDNVSNLNPFNDIHSNIEKEVGRLTEEERVKWIKRLGKSFKGTDEKLKHEWIETEKLQWILSKKETQSYWLDKEMKDIKEGKRGHISPSQKHLLKRYKQFKEFDENSSWLSNLQGLSDQINNSKWVRIYYDNPEIPSIGIGKIAKNSSEALEEILGYGMFNQKSSWPSIYEVFSVHEPKSSFNLVNSLFNKHWKKYPDMHNAEPSKRRKAFKDFWSDVKSGKMKDPEVELLGFDRYPKLEQTDKFEAPKKKMKM
ncbi:hypothetical protein [Mesomycoplasma ovipneumoniae]|uniref:hypothetical protein n=1 Tax=Mesomycoplasma ovipneumoniae TaxID=29562 RepID=UPI00083E8AFF|nr:hypothetical protein [Mesomycoplasma ovipneumoniae]